MCYDEIVAVTGEPVFFQMLCHTYNTSTFVAILILM